MPSANATAPGVDAAIVGRCVELRHRIHAHPELSGREIDTREIIVTELKEAGWQVRLFQGCPGVAAFKPGKRSGRCIALRADMDALPLQETSGLPWASKKPEIMHACGHDGHAALLLGVARHLASVELPCDVKLLFQPAEESGDGARRMIDEGALADPKVDAIFGLHGWPDMPLGRIGVHGGPVMASVDNFEITVVGRGGHGAQPQHTLDPIVGAAQLVIAAQTLVSRSIDPLESAVLTVGHLQGGHTYNVIPEECLLRGTFRAHNPAVRARLKAGLDRLRTDVCRGLGLDSRVTWDENCPATINHPAMAALARRAAARALGEGRCMEPKPSMAGEDFSFFLEKVPGAYVWLGLGDAAGPLHNPRFDFNDAAIGNGIGFFLALIEEWADYKADPAAG
jgi:hippurate hydrolase